MDTPSVIRDFLDENSIAAVRSVEIAYKYHAELEPGCRLTGCEIIMRAVGEDVFVRAELPVSVMTRETRGVVKYLADLNKKRIDEGKQGYFDLDYVAGKIIFGIRVRQPISTALLKDVAAYCVDQIEYESDELLRAVCDECEAALQEEEELRQQQEKKNREPSMFALLMRRLKRLMRNIIDPDAPRSHSRRGLPGADISDGDEAPEYCDPQDDDGEEYKFERRASEESPVSDEDAEPVQPESGEEDVDSDPEFRTLLKTLGLEPDDEEEETEETDPSDGEEYGEMTETPDPTVSGGGAETAEETEETAVLPDLSGDGQDESE